MPEIEQAPQSPQAAHLQSTHCETGHGFLLHVWNSANVALHIAPVLPGICKMIRALRWVPPSQFSLHLDQGSHVLITQSRFFQSPPQSGGMASPSRGWHAAVRRSAPKHSVLLMPAEYCLICRSRIVIPKHDIEHSVQSCQSVNSQSLLQTVPLVKSDSPVLVSPCPKHVLNSSVFPTAGKPQELGAMASMRCRIVYPAPHLLARQVDQGPQSVH